MTELKLCPLCKFRAIEILEGVSCRCSNANCRLSEPMDIKEWERRPIEDALQKEIGIWKYNLQETVVERDIMRDKFEYIDKLLVRIAAMPVTIILKDGTVINSGELASDALDKLRE